MDAVEWSDSQANDGEGISRRPTSTRQAARRRSLRLPSPGANADGRDDAIPLHNVLVAGFDRGLLQRLRQQAQRHDDVNLRLYSRRNIDFTPTDPAERYHVILLHADALIVNDRRVERALASFAPTTPVVIGGTRGDVRFAATLAGHGCEEIVTLDEAQPEALITTSVEACRRRRAPAHRYEPLAPGTARLAGIAWGDEHPLMVLDLDGNEHFVNPLAQEIDRSTRAQLAGEILRRPYSAGMLTARLEARAPDGRRSKFTIVATPAPQHQGLIVVRIPVQPEEILRRTRSVDVLTGLPDRVAIAERLDEWTTQASFSGRRAGLLMIEVDPPAPDIAETDPAQARNWLAAASQRLRQGLRGCDWLGHWGGRRFALLSTDPREASDLGHLARQLNDALKGAADTHDDTPPLHACIGIAVYPEDAVGSQALLGQAESALARARADGDNGYQYSDLELGRQLVRRSELESSLQEALDRRQFTMVFQPLVAATNSGEVCGAEVLLRWKHPVYGPQSPSDFIPALEHSGLIHAVGGWILRESCVQVQHWRAAGHKDFRLSVNVSPVQLRDPRFPDKVAEALLASGLPPAALVLEVTENVLLDRTDETVARLRALAALGVGLHIDDFGTGFSSIAYLKRLPFTGLKIDRAFIDGVAGDARDQALVKWMVELARLFGLETVAEGVETQQDADAVRAMGVDQIQGFLYGAGIGAREFETRYLQG